MLENVRRIKAEHECTGEEAKIRYALQLLRSWQAGKEQGTVASNQKWLTLLSDVQRRLVENVAESLLTRKFTDNLNAEGEVEAAPSQVVRNGPERLAVVVVAGAGSEHEAVLATVPDDKPAGAELSVLDAELHTVPCSTASGHFAKGASVGSKANNGIPLPDTADMTTPASCHPHLLKNIAIAVQTSDLGAASDAKAGHPQADRADIGPGERARPGAELHVEICRNPILTGEGQIDETDLLREIGREASSDDSNRTFVGGSGYAKSAAEGSEQVEVAPGMLREFPNTCIKNRSDFLLDDDKVIEDSRNAFADTIRGPEETLAEASKHHEEAGSAPPAAGPGLRFARPEETHIHRPAMGEAHPFTRTEEKEELASLPTPGKPPTAEHPVVVAAVRKPGVPTATQVATPATVGSSGSYLARFGAPDTNSVGPGQSDEEIKDFVRKWRKFHHQDEAQAIGQYCRHLYGTRPKHEDPDEEVRLQLNWRQSLSKLQRDMLDDRRRANKRNEYAQERVRQEGRKVRPYHRAPFSLETSTKPSEVARDDQDHFEWPENRVARQKRESAKRRYAADPEKKRRQSRDRMQRKRRRDRLARELGHGGPLDVDF